MSAAIPAAFRLAEVDLLGSEWKQPGFLPPWEAGPFHFRNPLRLSGWLRAGSVLDRRSHVIVLGTAPAERVFVLKIRMIVRTMIVELGFPRESQLALRALMDRHGQLRLVSRKPYAERSSVCPWRHL